MWAGPCFKTIPSASSLVLLRQQEPHKVFVGHYTISWTLSSEKSKRIDHFLIWVRSLLPGDNSGHQLCHDSRQESWIWKIFSYNSSLIAMPYGRYKVSNTSFTLPEACRALITIISSQECTNRYPSVSQDHPHQWYNHGRCPDPKTYSRWHRNARRKSIPIPEQRNQKVWEILNSWPLFIESLTL